nr:MAG TPA: minor capsid protein [Caudoviricetes sp.]
MADIGAELLEKIRAYFKKKCQGDAFIQSVLGKVAAGTAQMEEISILSQSIGFRASQAISEYVNVAALPDGKMYYNIADTILTGVLKDNYEIINSAAAECQRALDRKMGINIEPQRAPYPAERVQAVAGAASAPDISEEKMVRRMTSTTENITRSFYDDYVETNVKYRSEAGLECFIIRSDHGGCCKWCAALAGKYRYPEEVPKDVYRRHDNCTCTVTYTNGRKAQDVWSKTSREMPAEERERMREIGFKKPTVSAEEREQMLIAGMKKPQRLDFSAESGIIEIDKSELKKYIGKPITQTDNQHIREWYYANVSDIPNQIDKSKPFQEQVKQAFDLRNKYKRNARAAMSDEETARLLEERRPLPTFEDLLKRKMERKGMTKDEALKDILDTASKTNSEVNDMFGL